MVTQGTWEFMSNILLQSPDRANTIADDLESIFWVLLYVIAKRFMAPELEFPASLFYHKDVNEHGQCVGGTSKAASLSHRYYFGLQCKPLIILIDQCRITWFKHWTCICSEVDFGSETIDAVFRRTGPWMNLPIQPIGRRNSQLLFNKSQFVNTTVRS